MRVWHCVFFSHGREAEVHSNQIVPRVQGLRLSSLLDISNVGPNRNANLYLKARIYLRRHVPGPNETIQGVPVEPWEDRDWTRFHTRFKPVIEQGFNNKFWLIPDGFWGADHPSNEMPQRRPNIRCCLTVELAPRPEVADSIFVCVRIADGQRQNWRSNMTTNATMSAVHQFLGLSDRDGLLCQHDLDLVEMGYDRMVMSPEAQARIPEGGTVHMIVALHEFGHFLGLDHVCGHGNDREPYGVTPYQQRSLMGRGNEVRAAHSWPWRRRLRDHLIDYRPNFRVSMTRVLPRALTQTEIDHHDFLMQQRRMDPTRPSAGVPLPDGGVPLR